MKRPAAPGTTARSSPKVLKRPSCAKTAPTSMSPASRAAKTAKLKIDLQELAKAENPANQGELEEQEAARGAAFDALATTNQDRRERDRVYGDFK
eukprot:9447379-Pyramimonas_sp.AAC.1